MTFPLVWIGGLVTSYDAGMAVPDWPSTYGYNLFAYPWRSWFFGPWDLFVEHGHRLFAAFVGFLAIALVAAAHCHPCAKWVRVGAWGLLAFVLFQGGLGGARVLLSSRQFAQLHGIIGPLFFVSTVWMAWETSAIARRFDGESAGTSNAATRGARWGWLPALLTFVQLLLGSQVRHVDGILPTAVFRHAVFTHVSVGVALVCLAVVLIGGIATSRKSARIVRLLALGWSCLVVLQVMFGVASWLTKYGWPTGLLPHSMIPSWTLQANGFWSSFVSTAHVAFGSLLLSIAFIFGLEIPRDLSAERPRCLEQATCT
jgi:cytochrome c oxidase assembly protein subunit 15